MRNFTKKSLRTQLVYDILTEVKNKHAICNLTGAQMVVGGFG